MANAITKTDAVDLYKTIESATQIQIKRLLPTPDYTGNSRAKAQKIIAAIDRLCQAVIYKYKLSKEECSDFYQKVSFEKIEEGPIDAMDLSTIDTMLDAKINHWESEIEPWSEQGMDFNGRRAGYAKQISLRQALNIAQNNPFNSPGGTWGPLWGKTTALTEVEKVLYQRN